MNKTIIINIGNSIIHIEEEAYEILMAYLNEIKQHFAKNADDFEIVKDIENRIAEMFAEILQKGQKQVIEVADVHGIIAQMGSVQDFLSDEEEVQSENYYANYSSVKKLYRDTDEGVIAGVCAGLGHYLNVETRWLRLAFFLLTFLAGSSILVYFILWIAIPRASNRSERMEMKGEATNLYGYKRSFDEELAAFKANMKSANKHVAGFGSLIGDVLASIGKILGEVGRLIGKIAAWGIIIFGIGALIGLTILLGVMFGLWDNGVYNNFPFSMLNVPFKNELIFASFLVLFIPILGLVLLSIKMAFSHIQISKYVSLLLLGIWIVAVIATSFNVAKVISAFREEAEITKTIGLKPFKNYIFTIDPGMTFSKEDSLKYRLNNNANDNKIVIDKTKDGMFSNPKNVRLVFEKTDDDKVTITESFKSNGRNFEDALANSQDLIYKYHIVDSLITLTPRATLKKQTAWRDQNVVLTVKMPVGTQVVLNRDLYNYLKFYYYCNHDSNDNDAESEVWIMTNEGLRCKYEIDHPKEN